MLVQVLLTLGFRCKWTSHVELLSFNSLQSVRFPIAFNLPLQRIKLFICISNAIINAANAFHRSMSRSSSSLSGSLTRAKPLAMKVTTLENTIEIGLKVRFHFLARPILGITPSNLPEACTGGNLPDPSPRQLLHSSSGFPTIPVRVHT